MKRLALFTIVCLTGSGLAAQYRVSPPGYANSPGTGVSLVDPFSSTRRAQSFQQIADDMQGRAGTFKSLSLRRLNTGSPQKAWTLTLSITLSTARRNSDTVSALFAENMGQDWVNVLAGAKVNFASTAYVPGTVQPWFYHIPFARPFQYGGKAPLCLEMRITDNTIVDPWIYLDTVNVEEYPQGKGRSYKVPGQNYEAYCGTYLHYDRGTFTLEAYGGALPTKQMAFWLLGNSDRAMGSTFLPLDLAPLGLPGQSLYVEPLLVIGPVQVGALATPNQANFNGPQAVRFPNRPFMRGVRLFSQILTTWSGSPYGFPFLLTAYAWSDVPEAPLTVSCVTADGVTAVRGKVQRNAGYIIRYNL